MTHVGEIHQEKFLRGIWPEELIGVDQGETLHIEKCETVFLLTKGHVVYEKERNFHNLVLS